MIRPRMTAWLEQRTGAQEIARRFLYEEIPASSGWRQVFGSVAVFLFLVQAFTGMLLAFNYAPTPGDAYNSLRYIVTEVAGGRLIRGLHHWGASAMIVVVVLHMAQVFLYGAYKRPRETTWLAGVALLVLTLAYGLTGYLLPWDNRAYWGTVVVTRMAGQAPLAGPYLARLLGGSGPVGVVTFARFYGMHVLLLPPATFLLIAVHVYLVRKHGVAEAPGDEVLPPKSFFPAQAFKDTVAIFAVFATVFVMAAAVHVPLEELADPTDTSYVPRPEWYFLFLFQALKLLTGPLEAIGGVVLPGMAILALALVPFLDRGRVVRATRRFGAIACLALAALGWGGLTAAAMRGGKARPETAASAESGGAVAWERLTPEELAGVAYFRQEQCVSCHRVGDGPDAVGPDLTRVTIHKDAAWMIDHFKRPSSVRPGTSMPPVQLSDAQLNALAAFLLKRTPEKAAALRDAPEFAVQGAALYQQSQCGGCHVANGAGMPVGPELNGLAARRSREWVRAHFADPAKLSPNSIMPPYRFRPAEMDAITRYLFALPAPPPK